jgi:hypothetical protein
VAGQLGLRVVLIDHSARVAEKIRISGGGRSNFTNTQVSAANYLGQNPRFAKSALARYTPARFCGAGTQARHRFPRKTQGPVVLRPFGAGPDRHAAGRMRCRERQPLAALHTAFCKVFGLQPPWNKRKQL